MIKKIFLLVFVVALLAGCKTKFSVNGEYEERPVVHFLLNKDDDFHFLKLNKAFLKEGNAIEYAKDPSLSYFDEVNATVTEIKNGSEIRSWDLQDTTITNKKGGAFYAPKQKLYLFKETNLDSSAIYRLKIDINNGEHIVEGQTELVKGISITYPNSNQQLRFATSDVPINGYSGTSISFSKGPNAALYKVQIRFNYREYTTSGDEAKSILWDVGSRNRIDLLSSTPSLNASGEAFYELLKNRIDEDPAVTKRTIESFEILITGGTSDLKTYILTNEPSSSLAQNKPTYSNIDGALGIFTSRTTVRQFKSFDRPSSPNYRGLNFDSTVELCKGQYTGGLKFCSDHVRDESIASTPSNPNSAEYQTFVCGY